MENIGIAGNNDKGIKSDCWVQFELLDKGDLRIYDYITSSEN